MNKRPSSFRVDPDDLLDVLREHRGRALHVMEICDRLDVDTRRKDVVRDELELLQEEGLVSQLPGLRFRAVRNPAPKGAPPPSAVGSTRSSASRPAPLALLGRLTIHARGHGFVRAETGESLFVAPSDMGGALHGDRVAVQPREGFKGPAGTVIAVVERGSHTIAGTLEQRNRTLWLDARDFRVSRPVRVVGKLPEGASPGVEVVAELVEFPEDGGPLLAKVTSVLGKSGSAEVEVAKIKLREGVLEDFPEDALEEARAFGGRVHASEREDREDLRDLDLVTIDPKTARDHDDAIYIERLKKGYRVIIAIADVSHYVQEGSALDREALLRGTSIYLPDRAIPMLPADLSSHLASLVVGRDRLTLALEVELSNTGVVRKHRYIEGVMRCKANITYEGAAQALGWTRDGRRERAAETRIDMLETLAEAAALLRQRRMKRGSLDFDLPEPFVEMDTDSGEPVTVQRAKRDPGIRKTYSLVEEMMLLTNEVIATDLYKRRVPAIFRVHGKPDAQKLEQFGALAKAMGFRLHEEDLDDPKALASFLRSVDGTKTRDSLNYLLLRAMQQATYDTEDIGHFGLAAKHYLHFTSPIRRYPDIAVHRVVRKLARGQRIRDPHLESRLGLCAVEASRLERRAMQVEREVIDVYRALLVRDRVGEEFEATVTGVAPHGIYVAFDDPYVEAFCHVTSLGNDFYEPDQHGLRLVGRRSGASYGLGDPITVRLESANVAERSVQATPVVYVHRDDHDPMTGVDPVHESGTRRPRRKVKHDKDRPARNQPSKSRAPREKTTERQQQRRRERRTKDERKPGKRR